MTTQLTKSQIDWLKSQAAEEQQRRKNAYPVMIRRRQLGELEASRYETRWNLVCKILTLASLCHGKEEELLVKLSELEEARKEANREWYLRKKRYSKATPKGNKALTFTEKLVLFLEEQIEQRTGTQKTLF